MVPGRTTPVVAFG